MRSFLLILSAICAAPFVVVALFVFVPPLRGLFARLFARSVVRGIERGNVHVIYPNGQRPRAERGAPPGVIDTTGEDVTNDRPSFPKENS